MGKTLIFSDVDYSANAIPMSDLIPTISYDNAEIKAMVTTDTTGKYVNTSGDITSNGSLSYVIFDLTHYTRIIISGYSGTTTGGFFSSASPSSSTQVSAVTRSGTGSYDNFEIAIPAGATHFVFNLYIGQNDYALTKSAV